jgi:hypothetical protein
MVVHYFIVADAPINAKTGKPVDPVTGSDHAGRLYVPPSGVNPLKRTAVREAIAALRKQDLEVSLSYIPYLNFIRQELVI